MSQEPDTRLNGMPALYAALAKAQGEFKPIAKNRTVSIDIKDKTSGRKVGSYEFRYADLEQILAAVRPALSANGLSVVQVLRQDSSGVLLDTTLMHSSGGTITSILSLQKGNDVKQFGGAITYLRRYALTSLLCVAADDDLDENGQEAGQDQQATTQPANDNKEPGLQPYPQEKLEENLPAWRAAVSSGRTTPDRIVAMIESKNTLNKAQRANIMALAGAQAQDGEKE